MALNLSASIKHKETVKEKIDSIIAKRDAIQSELNSFVNELENTGAITVRILDDEKYNRRFTIGLNIDVKSLRDKLI